MLTASWIKIQAHTCPTGHRPKQRLHQHCQKHRAQQRSAALTRQLCQVIASAISKMVASTATYPHEVVRAHMHVAGSGPFAGFVTTCSSVRALLGSPAAAVSCYCRHCMAAEQVAHSLRPAVAQASVHVHLANTCWHAL